MFSVIQVWCTEIGICNIINLRFVIALLKKNKQLGYVLKRVSITCIMKLKLYRGKFAKCI